MSHEDNCRCNICVCVCVPIFKLHFILQQKGLISIVTPSIQAVCMVSAQTQQETGKVNCVDKAAQTDRISIQFYCNLTAVLI